MYDGPSVSACACVYVCACACVESEREKEREHEFGEWGLCECPLCVLVSIYTYDSNIEKVSINITFILK